MTPDPTQLEFMTDAHPHSRHRQPGERVWDASLMMPPESPCGMPRQELFRRRQAASQVSDAWSSWAVLRSVVFMRLF